MANWYDNFVMRVLTWGAKLTAKGSQLTKEEADGNNEILLTEINEIRGSGSIQPNRIPDWDAYVQYYYLATVKRNNEFYRLVIEGGDIGNDPELNPTIWVKVPLTAILMPNPFYPFLVRNVDLVPETIDGIEHLTYTIDCGRIPVNAIVRDSNGYLVNCQNIMTGSILKFLIDSEEQIGYYITIY